MESLSRRWYSCAKAASSRGLAFASRTTRAEAPTGSSVASKSSVASRPYNLPEIVGAPRPEKTELDARISLNEAGIWRDGETERLKSVDAADDEPVKEEAKLPKVPLLLALPLKARQKWEISGLATDLQGKHRAAEIAPHASARGGFWNILAGLGEQDGCPRWC